MASLHNSKAVSVVAFVCSFLLLLLLPSAQLVHGLRFVQVDMFVDKNCTEVPGTPGYSSSHGYLDFNQTPNITFPANPFNLSQTFESAILTNVTGDVLSLVACQAGLPCNATGAVQVLFDLSDVGACSTAGPAGTQFDKFLLS